MKLLEPNVHNVTLKPRVLPPDIVVTGKPQVHGRIIDVEDDGCLACVVWQMTPGAVAMKPNPDVRDLLFVLEGLAQVQFESGKTIDLRPGTWVNMPQQPYQLHVIETLKKISVLYNPNGLSMQAEH